MAVHLGETRDKRAALPVHHIGAGGIRRARRDGLDQAVLDDDGRRRGHRLRLRIEHADIGDRQRRVVPVRGLGLDRLEALRGQTGRHLLQLVVGLFIPFAHDDEARRHQGKKIAFRIEQEIAGVCIIADEGIGKGVDRAACALEAHGFLRPH